MTQQKPSITTNTAKELRKIEETAFAKKVALLERADNLANELNTIRHDVATLEKVILSAAQLAKFLERDTKPSEEQRLD